MRLLRHLRGLHLRARMGLAALACIAPAALLAQTPSGELRLRLDAVDQNPANAGVLARRLSDVVPMPHRSEIGTELDLRLKHKALYLDARLGGYSNRVGDTRASGRLIEGYLLAPWNGLKLSAGRRVLQWDVGFGFRPNDLIQQDPNRYLLTTRPQGRGVLQAEAFAPDASWTMVAVNPEHLKRPRDQQRGAKEAALAGMAFKRRGSTDLYAFVRRGRHTGLSVGGAFVGVLSDSVAMHASVRALQRRDGWTADIPASDSLLGANPWRQTTLGRTGQLLLGATWTGESRQSVLVEWWYDGTAVSDRQWNEWQARTGSLASQVRGALQGEAGAPPDALAANLAWQGTPLAGINQRRATFLVRYSWQPDPWTVYVDTLFNPVDSGQVVTFGLKWQGEQVRLDAALRRYGGPGSSVSANLPDRTGGLLAATWMY